MASSYSEGTFRDYDLAWCLNITPPEICPWDCQAIPNGNAGVGDMLEMFAQWGGPGSCDFTGDGVGIADLLELFANWGPCP